MNPSLRSQLIQLLAEADSRGYALASDKLLDTITNKAPLDAEPSLDVDKPSRKGMVDLLKSIHQREGKISAIKAHRYLTSVGLKESKDWVEKYITEETW